MIIDNSLILDSGLTLTTTGSSTNYIDTIGAAGGQAQISGVNTIQGGGDAYEQLWWDVIVLTTVTGTGGTVDFQLWTSEVVANIWTTGNAGSLPTASSNTAKLLSTGATGVALLISSVGKASAAFEYTARIPQGLKRYIAGFYSVAGVGSAGLTAGKWASYLVTDNDINLT